MRDNATVILTQLLGSFENVPTYINLCTDWDSFVEGQVETRQLIRKFLLKHNKIFILAINFSHLIRLSQQIQEATYRLPELTFEDMRLKTQEPSLGEVNAAITNIYQEIQVLVRYSEEGMHYIGVFRHAISYLDCWKKSVNEFVLDEDVCSLCFSNLSDRKRFSARMTADIEVQIIILKTHINNLISIVEKTLKPRQTMLLRADSALRLLTRVAEMEKAPGWVGLDTKTPHESKDISNFDVERV